MKKGASFDNFYVYDGNRIAYLAGQKIIQFPGEIFNPFYVFSNGSLGKTHLLWAIYEELRKKIDVLIFTGKEFEKYLDEAKEFNTPIIVDDINLIAEKYQDKILSMIDVLLLNEKQLCFSGNAAPRDLKNLNPKLISRLEGGLICDIQPPKELQLVEFIKKKSEEKGVIIPDEIALELAHLSVGSLRTIEGMVNRIAAYASLGNVTIDLSNIRLILKEFYPKGIYSPVSSLIEELKKNADEVFTQIFEEVDVRKEFKEKIYIWEMKGFDTSSLKPLLEGDIEVLTNAYNDFIKKVERLIELQREFGLLDTSKAPEEAIKVETMLFSVDKIDEIERLIEIIKAKSGPQVITGKFKEYLVGECNKTAFELYHKQVILNLGKKFNPYIILGESGTGKTYLLEAIMDDLTHRGLKVSFYDFAGLKEFSFDKNVHFDALCIDNFSEVFSMPEKMRKSIFQILMDFIKNDQPVFLASLPFSKDVVLTDDEKLTFELGIEVFLNPPGEDIVEKILKTKLSEEELEGIAGQKIPQFSSFYEIDEFIKSIVGKKYIPEPVSEVIGLGLPGEEEIALTKEKEVVEETPKLEAEGKEAEGKPPLKKLKEERLILLKISDELIEENY
uniref:Chromosomal replication initiator protein DnaA ATPAse domain-containing protein n=1 Tax=candidate division WOR-3 bacterium TaxID=2052148 RepID=A0A7C4XDR3_UNCW3